MLLPGFTCPIVAPPPPPMKMFARSSRFDTRRLDRFGAILTLVLCHHTHINHRPSRPLIGLFGWQFAPPKLADQPSHMRWSAKRYVVVVVVVRACSCCSSLPLQSNWEFISQVLLRRFKRCKWFTRLWLHSSRWPTRLAIYLDLHNYFVVATSARVVYLSY